MTFRELSELLKQLDWLDRADVEFLSDQQWLRFTRRPADFFIRADDAMQRALFEAVEATRQRSA